LVLQAAPGIVCWENEHAALGSVAWVIVAVVTVLVVATLCSSAVLSRLGRWVCAGWSTGGRSGDARTAISLVAARLLLASSGLFVEQTWSRLYASIVLWVLLFSPLAAHLSWQDACASITLLILACSDVLLIRSDVPSASINATQWSIVLGLCAILLLSGLSSTNDCDIVRSGNGGAADDLAGVSMLDLDSENRKAKSLRQPLL
jgi:hypothetical protein